MVFPPLPAANYAQLLVAQAVASKVVPFTPAAFQSGGETWFEGSGAFILTDQGAWRRVWDRHIQNESIGSLNGVGNLNPPPAIDFEKSVVVALFAGPQKGFLGYQVQGGYALGKQATLRLIPVVNARPGIAVPRPWAFMVLPRTEMSVSIQIPGQNGWNTILKVSPNR